MGDVSGKVTAVATGGNATAVDDTASADADASGVDGDVENDVSGLISATALGGTAYSSNGYATADADAVAVDDYVYGDVSGRIIARATGGTATGNDADADAETYGVGDDVEGDVSGMISAIALGGSAIGSNGYAYAEAIAHGVDGDVENDVSGTISALAEGGTAYSFNSVSGAYADAEAYGVGYAEIYPDDDDDDDDDDVEYGSVYNNVSGEISAVALGGTAISSNGNAEATATAVAVGGSVDGNVSGQISAQADAGTATAGNAEADASAYASGVSDGVGGNISGQILAAASAGTATGEIASANAEASGIGGDFAGDITGAIGVSAVAGTAVGGESAEAEARVAGIYGDSVAVFNFTGDILAEATAGLEIAGGVTNVSSAEAAGIMATDELYLNATGGSIQAMVYAPEGYSQDDLAEGSGAYAILSSNANDYVSLANMDVVGDIELGGGTNSLWILDDTSLAGDISATDGDLLFNIESGTLTLVGSTAVSDLSDALRVSSDGALSFLLYNSPANELNSKLVVDGSVEAEDGASLLAEPAAGQSAAVIVGKTYQVITATDGVSGTFVENTQSLFGLSISNGVDAVYITPTGLKFQQTPAPYASRASSATLHTVMRNFSGRVGGVRALVRAWRAEQAAPATDAPDGPSGPRVWKRRPDGSTQWYVRQFNDLGGVDSSGSVAGYDWETHGVMVGMDQMVNEKVLVGIAVGGAWTDLDGQRGEGGGASDMIIAGVYGSYVQDAWYSEMGLSYGQAQNDSQRIDTIGNTYEGEYDSGLVGTWLEFGYMIPVKDAFSLEPYARTSYAYGSYDGYTDKGSTAPMTVDSVNTDSLIGELGLRGRNKWSFENGSRFNVGTFAGWRYEFADDRVSVDTTVLGVSQKSVTPETGRSAIVLGLSGDWELKNDWSFGLEYSPTFSEDWNNHSVNGTMRRKF
jgi:uncharacterized protein with beta-barrel porin domain